MKEDFGGMCETAAVAAAETAGHGFWILDFVIILLLYVRE